MKLLIRAAKEIPRPKHLPLVLGQERDMRGRQLACRRDFDQRVGESAAHRVGFQSGPDEQTRTGHRRERHRHLKLWIVGAAGALKRFCPAVVENVLSARVRLHVARGDPQELAGCVFREKVSGLPTGSSTHRSRCLKRAQKFV